MKYYHKLSRGGGVLTVQKGCTERKGWGYFKSIDTIDLLHKFIKFGKLLKLYSFLERKAREHETIENRIIYREELKESLGMKGSSKCTNHVNVHKLYAVEYINTVCSLDYPFQFRIF